MYSSVFEWFLTQCHSQDRIILFCKTDLYWKESEFSKYSRDSFRIGRMRSIFRTIDLSHHSGELSPVHYTWSTITSVGFQCICVFLHNFFPIMALMDILPRWQVDASRYHKTCFAGVVMGPQSMFLYKNSFSFVSIRTDIFFKDLCQQIRPWFPVWTRCFRRPRASFWMNLIFVLRSKILQQTQFFFQSFKTVMCSTISTVFFSIF